MERVLSNEERIRRAEAVAIRRRMSENRNEIINVNRYGNENRNKNRYEKTYKDKNGNVSKMVGIATTNSTIENDKTPHKKISRFAKFCIQVISSICIFGIVYYLGQNYSQTVNSVRPFFEHDTDIVKQASEFYNLTKSIFTGENLNYWKNKWRN